MKLVFDNANSSLHGKYAFKQLWAIERLII